jgi:tetratricopeptide (TPR) repeat protein
MSKQDTAADPTQERSPTGNAFSEHVKYALEHFHDPAWLGTYSPLAEPYLLGEYLRKHPEFNTVTGHGKALRTIFVETALSLYGSHAQPDIAWQYGEWALALQDGTQDQQILYWSYFHSSALTAGEVIAKLDYAAKERNEKKGVSKATYYRKLRDTLKRFEDALIERFNPALRLETPAYSDRLVGRDATLAACCEHLVQGKTVALIGPNGVGKTTLGTALARHPDLQPAFWFTFRPGVNDHLMSMLFALAYFLHLQGATELWKHLITFVSFKDERGEDKPQLAHFAPLQVRHALESLGDTHPLLCFDDVDLLQPSEVEAHAQIISFLEDLCGLTPVLFIGVKPAVECDITYEVSGLTISDMQTWFTQEALSLSDQQLVHLYHHTQGNPRLLELFTALYTLGDSLERVLNDMSRSPSLEFLLNRVIQRLSDEEQGMLFALCVFRRPAPAHAWKTPQEAAALKHLIARHLVQSDGEGGVELLPTFRDKIYATRPAEHRETLHVQAALIRAAYGEYTSAAYHFIHAGDPHTAIWLWHEHQMQEINQGHASEALHLFENLSPRHLRDDDQQVLHLLRANLHILVGQYDRVRQTLAGVQWTSRFFTLQAERVRGDAAELMDNIEEAHHAYQSGLQTLELLLSQEVVFHRDIAWIYKRQPDAHKLGHAWNEACIARYKVERLQGDIQEELGNFVQAQQYYESALALAEAVGDQREATKTRNHLATVLAQCGLFDEAFDHWETALAYVRAVGDQTLLASVLANQANGLYLADHYQKAIEAAGEARALFNRFGETLGESGAMRTLADAHVALGNLAEAEEFAMLVFRTEDEYGIYDAFRVFGEVRLHQGNYQEAIHQIQQAITVAQQELHDEYREAYARRVLGLIYQAQGERDKARAEWTRVRAMFEALAAAKEVEKTSRLIASL